MANTVSVTAGSAIVVGDVTAFVGAPGDLFILGGLACPIASVDSSSQLTLQFPWPGATLAGQTRWLLRNDGPHWSSTVAYNQQLASFIPTVEGELYDLSQQVAGKQANLGFVPARQSDLEATNVTVASKQASLGFTPARQSDLYATNQDVAGKQANLGFTPVQQNGGAGQGSNKVYLGWAATGVGVGKLKVQVDAADLGTVWTDYSAPLLRAQTGYQILPSGLILEWGFSASQVDIAIPFPVTFPANVIYVGAQLVTGGGAANLYGTNVLVNSLSSFTVFKRYVSGGSVGFSAEPFYWFALGY